MNTPNVEHSYLRDFRVVLFTPSGKIYNFLSFFSLRSTWTEPVFQVTTPITEVTGIYQNSGEIVIPIS
ncbi:hypothetical protein DU80_06540 [Methanosarcina mazei]|uniref:Uncharacterized protein n=1 Tax=Methanosarcina mazei TaxID=2209 RepID=A0A0F8RSX2_METMZ|nr:hypothetical protein DU47_20165 [Methanosarcina mazei]KKH90563.1 hypothetical protein DU80_06540 [Methanosarcina mazei]